MPGTVAARNPFSPYPEAGEASRSEQVGHDLLSNAADAVHDEGTVELRFDEARREGDRIGTRDLSKTRPRATAAPRRGAGARVRVRFTGMTPLDAFRDRIRFAWERLNRQSGGAPSGRAAYPGRDRTADPEAPTKEEPQLQKAGFAEEALPWLNAVYRFALRLTRGDDDAAQDLVQETFLRAYRSWESYTRGTSCRSWLFTICRNAFLHHEERSSTQRETVASQIEADVEMLAMSDAFGRAESIDPERRFFTDAIDDRVIAAIDRLPPDFRDVLVMSDLGDLTYPEIAQVLEIPVGTVKSRLFRARRLLQDELLDFAVESGYVTGADQ